MAVFQTPGAVC